MHESRLGNLLGAAALALRAARHGAAVAARPDAEPQRP